MGNRFTFGTALYHPTIDIKDSAWLRSAVLFWDNIQTIVPEIRSRPCPWSRSGSCCESDTYILFQEGILSPLAPERHPDVLEQLEADVMGFLDDLSEHQFMGIREAGAGLAESDLLHAAKMGSMLEDAMSGRRHFGPIHGHKILDTVRGRLGATTPMDEKDLSMFTLFLPNFTCRFLLRVWPRKQEPR